MDSVTIGELIEAMPLNLRTNREDPDFYNSDWSDSQDDLDPEDWEQALEPEGMDEDSDQPFDMEDEMEKDDYGDDEADNPPQI